ncbi:hypothetical protein OH77DRAFT_109206 [Trametes cingulata]|nr:hypothetical protein OH77DRAFT_109206 [Trametes cingulata]
MTYRAAWRLRPQHDKTRVLLARRPCRRRAPSAMIRVTNVHDRDCARGLSRLVARGSGSRTINPVPVVARAEIPAPFSFRIWWRFSKSSDRAAASVHARRASGRWWAGGGTGFAGSARGRVARAAASRTAERATGRGRHVCIHIRSLRSGTRGVRRAGCRPG